jgi:transposase
MDRLWDRLEQLPDHRTLKGRRYALAAIVGIEPPPDWWTPLVSFARSGKVSNGSGRGHFRDEFKTEAIALLAGSGRRLVEIAGELGISPSMLRNWRNRQEGQHAGSAVPAKPASAMPCVADRAAEISRLRRENDRLCMERDISGKAVALFSEAPR